jgi:hypothetical protein
MKLFRAKAHSSVVMFNPRPKGQGYFVGSYTKVTLLLAQNCFSYHANVIAF